MYSRVSKYSQARKQKSYRSTKGKSCGYYMRIVFFFSSLIQSLIIVSLVLFLVYGQQHDPASNSSLQDLETRFSQLSLETLSLREQRRNLTHLLNATVQDKTRNEWDLAKLRSTVNTSYFLLFDLDKKLQQCNYEKNMRPTNCQTDVTSHMNPFFIGTGRGGCNCGMELEICKGHIEGHKANFTQIAMKMQMAMDQMAKERDNINLEVIQLRRDKFVHEQAIALYQIKCKEEFVNSLSGITNVSKAFLTKINSLFSGDPSFWLTCPKQTEYLQQIRTNCTNLSEEVVQKFQKYLDSLGSKVSMSQGKISVLTAENMRMTQDYNLCSQNRTWMTREHKQNVERIQRRNDDDKEKLLMEKKRLNGDIEVLEKSQKLKNFELDHLRQQLQHLNLSCMPRTGGGLFPRPASQPGSTGGFNTGSSSSGFANSGGQPNRNNFGSSSSSSSSSSGSFGSSGTNSGLGSSNSNFNKPSSTGLGSSSLGSSSSSSLGSSNKQGSSNQGSSFGSFGSSSSSNTGLNKQTSLFGNPSSSSSSQNKFGSSGGTGASSSNSNFGSSNSNSNSNFGSSNSNSNSNSNFGSSNSNLGSSSSNSNSKFGSSSSNFGSSNSNQGSSSSNFGSSNSNQGSSSSNFGSSNSNQGSSNSNQGSSSSKFGSSSSNLGSSNSNFGSSSSNTGSNFGSSSNSNLGSSSSSSKTALNSKPSTSLFGLSSSSNSNLGSSSSSSLNKQSSSSSKSSPSSSSSSSGSSSTANKAFAGWGWLAGPGSSSSSSSSSNSNSNSDQNKQGSSSSSSSSNQGRGSSSSGTGFGSFGRSNTFSFTGPISYNEHMQQLQRIINQETGPEERREVLGMMG